MGYILNPSKFNKNTWLIDAAYKRNDGTKIKNGHAAYLIKTEDGSNCLINSGARSGAPSIFEKLKKLGAWPLEKLIITHSHWDHTQGVIYFRKKVEEEDISPIEVFASERAIPYLKDQSYNSCFAAEAYYSEFLNIENVKPLKDKEKIYISEYLILEIIETPGHMPDHISIYDKKNKTVFVGDAIGMHWFPDFYVCNSNSTYWKEKDYLESIKKLKMLDLEFLCIAHFGVITEEDIGRFFDNSVSMYYKWMELFDQKSDKLDNPHFLIDSLWNSVYNDFSDKPILKDTLEIAVLNAINYYKGLKSL